MWLNNHIIKAQSIEQHESNFKFQYNKEDPHFDNLRRCAVMNSTAVFTISLPEHILHSLDAIKETDYQKYLNQLEKETQSWQQQLSTTPFFKRNMIGDASEIALMKFY